jgi:hypothetical protein
VLSENQTTILRRIVDAGRPVSVGEIADWEVSGPFPFGENAARNATKRMEDRALVVGSGAGRNRTYVPTRNATEELGAGGAPGVEDQDSSPDSSSRNYVVLERVALEDLEAWLEAQQERGVASLEPQEVYIAVAKVDARNTEHALRCTAREAYEEVDADPVLVPVAERMWQPATVQIRNRQTVSISA